MSAYIAKFYKDMEWRDLTLNSAEGVRRLLKRHSKERIETTVKVNGEVVGGVIPSNNYGWIFYA